MEQQAAAYQELAGLFNQLSEGEEISAPADKVSELVAKLVELKEEGSTLEKPEGEENVAALQDNKAYSEAIAAFFEAQNNLALSGKLTAEISAALLGFHKAPKPQAGEGRQ